MHIETEFDCGFLILSNFWLVSHTNYHRLVDISAPTNCILFYYLGSIRFRAARKCGISIEANTCNHIFIAPHSKEELSLNFLWRWIVCRLRVIGNIEMFIIIILLCSIIVGAWNRSHLSSASIRFVFDTKAIILDVCDLNCKFSKRLHA